MYNVQHDSLQYTNCASGARKMGLPQEIYLAVDELGRYANIHCVLDLQENVEFLSLSASQVKELLKDLCSQLRLEHPVINLSL